MLSPDEKFATPRIAAGVLFVEEDRIFLVRKTYGNRWDIPGGYVEQGESPASACRREMVEEIGIDRVVRRVLVHDWAPGEIEGDKILYVFDCGELGRDQERVVLDGDELDHWQWVPLDRVEGYVIPRLARRIRQACFAHSDGIPRYLEHGEPVLACSGSVALRRFDSRQGRD